MKNESKVLVLYTGGTIGMVRNAEGALAPQPHAMETMIRYEAKDKFPKTAGKKLTLIF